MRPIRLIVALLAVAVLIAVPAALASVTPELKLKGPKTVQAYEEYRIKAVGVAKKDGDVVSIFAGAAACPATAGKAKSQHLHRLEKQKTVDKGDFVVKGPKRAEEFSGKQHFCGYLSKSGGATRILKEKYVTVQGGG
ncbi:MAG: hypothetical protein QOG41_640 [Thermoleophilaceae bacterium]|jgi:hypothetical protein|nr:hypothetical protein [Thermoleophilaceae bacterium]